MTVIELFDMKKSPSHSDTRSLTDGDYFEQNTKSGEHMFY